MMLGLKGKGSGSKDLHLRFLISRQGALGLLPVQFGPGAVPVVDPVGGAGVLLNLEQQQTAAARKLRELTPPVVETA